jgi:hypothetical protein
MALTNAEKQASRRERNLKNENGTKLRAQFIFDASTRAHLKRIARHKGRSVTSLIKEWAASAERRATHQLSGKALKQYYEAWLSGVIRTTGCTNQATPHCNPSAAARTSPPSL